MTAIVRIMNDNLERTDVVIVGAGPTGLTAAIRLAQLGVPYVLLDVAAAPTSTSNAALMHAASLELFAELGVSDELVAAGRKMTRITMVDRGKPLIRLKLTNLPTRYAFALGIPQSTTEEILLGRLSALGGSVRRLHRVTSVDMDADAPVVTGTVESADGPRPFVIHTRYVIGADGSHSVVRAAIGLDFRGETYPAQFVLADVALDNSAGADGQATINMSAHGVTVLGLLPSGNHRIIATVDATVDAPQTPDRSFVDTLLRERAIPARSIAEPVWSSRFRVHHRVAFRAGFIAAVATGLPYEAAAAVGCQLAGYAIQQPGGQEYEVRHPDLIAGLEAHYGAGTAAAVQEALRPAVAGS